MTTLTDVFNLLKGRQESVNNTVDQAVAPAAAAPVAPVSPAVPNGTGAAQNLQHLDAKKALDAMTPQQMEELRKQLALRRQAQQNQAPSTQY